MDKKIEVWDWMIDHGLEFRRKVKGEWVPLTWQETDEALRALLDDVFLVSPTSGTGA
jgi:hypothetical protein